MSRRNRTFWGALTLALIFFALAVLVAVAGSAIEAKTAEPPEETGTTEVAAAPVQQSTDTLIVAASASIIIREGLEAVLVLAAILGCLRAAKAPRRYTGWLAGGAVAALGASFLTWIAAQSLLTLTEANREAIEGATSLLAVIVIFFVTNWLFQRIYVQDWTAMARAAVGTAVAAGSALALAGLGFTVVYREGLETVLFYQALLFNAAAGEVALGFVLGAAVITGIAILILRMSQRLPLKPFFTATTVLLLIMAINFTGSGVHELQEAGLIRETVLSWLPSSPFLKAVLGFRPTAQTIAAQLVLGGALALSFAYSRRHELPAQVVINKTDEEALQIRS